MMSDMETSVLQVLLVVQFVIVLAVWLAGGLIFPAVLLFGATGIAYLLHESYRVDL